MPTDPVKEASPSSSNASHKGKSKKELTELAQQLLAQVSQMNDEDDEDASPKSESSSIQMPSQQFSQMLQLGGPSPLLVSEPKPPKVTSKSTLIYQSLSSGNFTSSPFLDTNLEAPLEKLPPRKKPKTEFEANNNSVETITRAELVEKVYVGMDSIAAITTEIRGMHSLMEKREKEREKTNNVWDAIKETPNLDNRARYKALGLVHKLGMKNAFLKMSPEERSEWILYTME
ncbi:hypothetical protein CerSpe_169630 [Prunus speciosa]